MTTGIDIDIKAIDPEEGVMLHIASELEDWYRRERGLLGAGFDNLTALFVDRHWRQRWRDDPDRAVKFDAMRAALRAMVEGPLKYHYQTTLDQARNHATHHALRIVVDGILRRRRQRRDADRKARGLPATGAGGGFDFGAMVNRIVDKEVNR